MAYPWARYPFSMRYFWREMTSELLVPYEILRRYAGMEDGDGTDVCTDDADEAEETGVGMGVETTEDGEVTGEYEVLPVLPVPVLPADVFPVAVEVV